MSQNMQTGQTGQSVPSFQRTPNGPDNAPAPAGEQANRYGSYGGTTAAPAEGRAVAAAGQPARAEAVTTLVPPVDIYEDETGLTLLADMPGVAKEQLGVRVTGDNLVIEGTASVPAMASMELVYGEVQTPQYRRSFTLGRELDPGRIEARLSNGVLTLRIPKTEEAKPRRINVSVG
jgi:HSP20 family molecular chaperone IbpA